MKPGDNEPPNAEKTFENIKVKPDAEKTINFMITDGQEDDAKPVTLHFCSIDIVDGEGEHLAELKMGKMENALSAQGELDIDQDEDRFYVRAIGADAFNGVSIKLETRKNPKASYDDDKTKIDLESKDGNLQTKSLLLVADTVDDSHDGNGGTDDDVKNDRTHLIQLGGKMRVSEFKVDGETNALKIEREVPVKKVLTGRIIFVGNQAVDENGNPEEDEDGKPVVDSVGVIKFNTTYRPIAIERYTQTGVKFDLFFSEMVAPANVDPDTVGWESGIIAEGGVGGGNSVHQDLKAIIDKARGLNLLDTITVFVVPDMLYEIAGKAITKRYTAPQENEYINVAFLSWNDIGLRNKIFTLPHEVGHILTNHGHYGDAYAQKRMLYEINYNLMRERTSESNQLNSSKRIYVD